MSSPVFVSSPSAAVGGVIDFRSDTVTQPTAAMRAAMAAAEVGDDVFGEDPAVNELQRVCAELLGKEAGLFVPSGTMGNLLALLVHVDARGGEMIIGDQSHIHCYEQGNHAQFGGIHTRTVPNQPDGTLDLEAVQRAIRPPGLSDDHLPQTQLICVENTQNRCGGRALPASYMDALGKLARENGVKLHVDGARLLNAAVSLGVSPSSLVASADSVSLCLSKGLAAPVGSVLVGSANFVRRARRLRKALGGGMRQAGVLAAAGLIAVREMSKGLALDHARTRQIAALFRDVDGVSVPAEADIHSNIFHVTFAPSFCTSAQFQEALATHHIRVSATDASRVRFVLHYMVDDEAVTRASAAIKSVLDGFKNKQ
jgi:threonine aldolase